MKNESAAAAHNLTSVKEIESNAKTRMEKALADLQHEMTGLRTGRASVALLDNIRVDYYGTPTPLNQVATLHVPEPAMITIQPWDTSQIGPIEKSIRSSDLGLNPSNDGKIVRVPIPPLTEERRRDLAKKLSHFTEERRVSFRDNCPGAHEQPKKLTKKKLISD